MQEVGYTLHRRTRGEEIKEKVAIPSTTPLTHNKFALMNQQEFQDLASNGVYEIFRYASPTRPPGRVPRSSAGAIAERLPDGDEHAMQQFLTDSISDFRDVSSYNSADGAAVAA